MIPVAQGVTLTSTQCKCHLMGKCSSIIPEMMELKECKFLCIMYLPGKCLCINVSQTEITEIHEICMDRMFHLVEIAASVCTEAHCKSWEGGN